MSVTLSELVARGLARRVDGDASTVVRGVRHDSRAVEAGDLFVAVSGIHVDGAKFAADAIARGAAAIAVERELTFDVPQLIVEDARRALGALAAAVYGDPTETLRVVGVTGTNGKTTTTWIIDEALRALGEAPALLGTVESRGPGMRAPAPYTTPEGDAIARFARSAADGGATHLVMEVSSHALAQHRADAVGFDVAAFTNLTQDHLDYHSTMDAYFEAKARLFTELAPRVSVINVDDPWGRSLAGRVQGDLLRVSRTGAADLAVERWSMDRDGIHATISHRGSSFALESPMLGAHNLDNLLLAFGCLLALDVDVTDALRAVELARGAPGRLERVEGLEGVRVLVDYAHTPDALERALAALRPITPGKLIVVFGCGGDRDRAKRPIMGEVAARGADLALVTSDNPRTEDPFAILAAIEPGVLAGGMTRAALGAEARGYDLVEDRRDAIRRAIEAARPGDTVLIAGKGHEDYQIRGTTKVHFDDREEAGAAIAARGGGET